MTLLVSPKLDVVTKAVTTIRAIHTIVCAIRSRVYIMHDNRLVYVRRTSNMRCIGNICQYNNNYVKHPVYELNICK